MCHISATTLPQQLESFTFPSVFVRVLAVQSYTCMLHTMLHTSTLLQSSYYTLKGHILFFAFFTGFFPLSHKYIQMSSL